MRFPVDPCRESQRFLRQSRQVMTKLAPKSLDLDGGDDWDVQDCCDACEWDTSQPVALRPRHWKACGRTDLILGCWHALQGHSA